MKKRFFALVFLGFVSAAVVMAGGQKASIGKIKKSITIANRRGVSIPAVLIIPGNKGKYPVVLMAHGQGGGKDDAYLLDTAEALTEQGIASLCMDFPGSGASKEDFAQCNRISYMLDDLRSCKDYLAKESLVDLNRLGIMGYSMGGRIAALAAADDPVYKSIVFWSPAISPGGADMYVFMQLAYGEADFNRLYDEAKTEGRITYTSVYGFDQTLGLGWFEDMLAFNPLAHFSAYKGDILLITGSKDFIVPPKTAQQIIDAAVSARSVKTINIQGAEHGFGFYSNEPEISRQTVNETVSFFKKTL